jgi:hypothetical protein
MNGSNAHSAMSANKAFGRGGRRAAAQLLLLGACLWAPSLAEAQGSAPALFNVGEIIVQYTHFGDPQAADACGLVREDLANIINKSLIEDGVPAFPVTDAKPAQIGVARIDLVPEIYSFSSNGLDCVSWISLTAKNTATVEVPPVDAPRSVTVIYWQQGLMLSSSQSLHARVVGEAMQKLVKKFAQKYKLDQPPPLPEQ